MNTSQSHRSHERRETSLGRWIVIALLVGLLVGAAVMLLLLEGATNAESFQAQHYRLQI